MSLFQQRIQQRARDGFSLVEMIGVVAILSILASLLIPRVFQAITDSKVSSAVTTCANIKIAVNEYYGTYGRIAGLKGVPLGLNADGAISEDWDVTVLIAEGIADKPFALRIGNGRIGSAAGGSRVRIINISGNNATTPVAADADALADGAYNLDGAHPINDVSGTLLVEGVIEEVDVHDARTLNDRLDGSALGAVDAHSADEKGRVKYAAPVHGKTTVHIYFAHR